MGSWAARAIVSGWYALALAVCRVLPRAGAPRGSNSGYLVITGAFHNPGWFVSHVTPLGRCGFRRVLVVTHGDLPSVEGVTVEGPPRWLTVLTGRAFSKLIWTIRVGLRVNADVFMGYHILPNSTTSLIAARLLGRPSCYQMTAGPIEVIGGGCGSWENPILRRLRRPSSFLEGLGLAVVRQFDLVVVRGMEARRFVQERAAPPRVEIVPGSVDVSRFSGDAGARTYDAIFVGQLVPRKQPLLFVDVVRAVRDSRPIRAAIVGDGPLMPDVRRRIAELGLDGAIDLHGRIADVGPLLSRSRVFVLPSRSEGLSIAMAEAMICGAVPVVADVGDLKDLVKNGETGYLIPEDDVQQYARRIETLLNDVAHWEHLSRNASRAARANNGLDEVTARWAEHLGRLAAPAPTATLTAAS
jgi:glycosyltransferase involved in cell wall biosynthesis